MFALYFKHLEAKAMTKHLIVFSARDVIIQSIFIKLLPAQIDAYVSSVLSTFKPCDSD